MPTVLTVDGYRFFFFSNEGDEQPHIHVEHGDGLAKFWLHPIRLAGSKRMKTQEVRRARELAEENEPALWEAWHAFHGE
jgi:hypothetical protein